MKKQIKWGILSSALIMSANEGQVDYSKCRDYLTPSGGVFGGYSGRPAGYLPFELKQDGSIEPHQDVVSYEKDKDGRTEVITYEIPSYMAGVFDPSRGGGGFYSNKASEDDNKRSNPFKQDMRKVLVRIERNDQGHLTKIVTNNNLTPGELSGIQKRNNEYLRENMSEEQLQAFKKKNGGQEIESPLYQRKGSEISLKILNGQCVPVEHEERYHVEAKADGETRGQRIYNTELCHDINDFLNEHPETAACFDPKINKKMSDIFKSYYREPKPLPQGGGFPGYGSGGGLIGGFGGGFGGLGFGLDANIMRHTMRLGDGEQQKKFDQAMGSSPVITSQMILQGCYQMGLGSFIDDPTIWQKTGAVSGGGNGHGGPSSPAVGR